MDSDILSYGGLAVFCLVIGWGIGHRRGWRQGYRFGFEGLLSKVNSFFEEVEP